MVYIRAQEGPANIGESKRTVQYFDEQGNIYFLFYVKFFLCTCGNRQAYRLNLSCK
jgi:hypothetical protein